MNSISFESRQEPEPAPAPEKSSPFKKKRQIKNSIDNEEYSLTSNTFDPSNSKPPSPWIQRLAMRINSYDDLKSFDTQ